MSWSHPAEAPWILGFWEKLSVGRGSYLRHQSACLTSMGTRVWVPELTFLYKPGMVYILVILAEVVAPWDSLPVNLAYLENSVLMRDFASYKGRQHLREDTWGCWSPYTHADICKWSPIYICVATHTHTHEWCEIPFFFCLSWNIWIACHAATAHLHRPPLLLSPSYRWQNWGTSKADKVACARAWSWETVG